MDNATNLTGKTLKNCTMFEKNFPDNAIVAKVRKSAEAFKVKLPVFAHLRNPALKGVINNFTYLLCLSSYYCPIAPLVPNRTTFKSKNFI